MSRTEASDAARVRTAIEPLLAAGHVDHALIELQQVLSARPDDAGVLDLAAAVLCGAGQFAQALACAQRAVQNIAYARGIMGVHYTVRLF